MGIKTLASKTRFILVMFKIGDRVKRVGSSYSEGGNVEALGMTGVIVDISPEGEWFGRNIPKMYLIDFPDLYTGTEHEGVLLGVIEQDLESA